ncbi:MAG: hypothetical protein RJA55_1352 [Acidobacteriota bacterium]
MNPRTWLARWVPEPDGRAARLPLSLLGMLITAVQTMGFALFEGMPLLAALTFSVFCFLGWMAACDGRSLLVDLRRGRLVSRAQAEATRDDAACATRRYTRRPAGVTARSGGVSISPGAGVAWVSTASLAGMPCPPTVH